MPLAEINIVVDALSALPLMHAHAHALLPAKPRTFTIYTGHHNAPIYLVMRIAWISDRLMCNALIT